MDKQYTFTVLVLTYNPNDLSLYRTLDSVIRQKDVSFEIVISDDGSSSFNREGIIDFLADKGFDDYRICLNTPNRGTVSNVLAGVKASRGQFIKCISPGDYLYADDTLLKVSRVLEERNASVLFGKAAHYYLDDAGTARIKNVNFPHDLDAYRESDGEKIRFNYIFHRDYILGASFVVEKALYEKYLPIIEGRLKYEEDACVIPMVCDGIIPIFMDDFIVWYESDSGISNDSGSKWTAILAEENREIYRILAETRRYDSRICGWWSGENRGIMTLFFRLHNRLYWERVWNMEKRNCHNDREADISILEDILRRYSLN